MQKVQKLESANIQSDCKTTSKKRTNSFCVFTLSGKVQKGGEHQYTMIMKQQLKNEEIKRKQTCSMCFVKVFKFQENKFIIVQKNF